MRTRTVVPTAAIALLAIVGGLPGAARAQSASSAPLLSSAAAIVAEEATSEQPTAPAQGPLVVQRIKSGFVFGPDVKVTQIDGTTGALAGGYAGWLVDETFLIGGAGYWLAGEPHDIEMGYGGVVVGWQVNGERRIAFGGRGLVGLGQATTNDTIDLRLPVRDVPGMFGRPGFGDIPTTSRSRVFRYRETFYVVEPQLEITVRLADRLHLQVGAGYRFVGTEFGADDRLRGATGSVAIRFGAGSR
ncbi:MAG: hypothetical protein U0Q12_18040 [Vicinamibacterales bacterium]